MLFSGYTRIMEQTQCDGAPAENWDTLRYKKALIEHLKAHTEEKS